jgi:low affinity Fe/Cu permease
VTSADKIPKPSDAVLIRLAAIAAHADELLAADQQTRKAPVGLTTIKNDRRRTMEAILVMLADADVRGYIAELEKLGLLPVTR